MNKLRGEDMENRERIKEMISLYKEQGYLTEHDILSRFSENDPKFDEMVIGLAYNGLLPNDFMTYIDKTHITEKVSNVDLITMISDCDETKDGLERKNPLYSSFIDQDIMSYYEEEVQKIEKITKEEEEDLIQLVYQERIARLEYLLYSDDLSEDKMIEYSNCFRLGEEARHKLSDSYLSLVLEIVNNVDKMSLSLIDLVQIGNHSVIESLKNIASIDRNRFKDYLEMGIKEAIKSLIERQSKDVLIPVQIIADINRYVQAERALLEQLKELPTEEQLSEKLNISIEKIDQIRNYMREPLSI